jgi:Cu+-exporting ATPase
MQPSAPVPSHAPTQYEAPAATARLELPIGGMTCASCAARVERSLGDVEGVVDASVNSATETAVVAYDPARVDRGRLVAAVESSGYGIRTPDSADGGASALRRRLAASALLSLPVLLLSMVPALRFDGWEPVALALAAPVVLWGGSPSTAPRSRASATARRAWTR